MRQTIKLAILAGMIVTLPACPAAQNIAAASWPGTWPPPAGMNCPRNNAVSWSSLATELTNLHESPACVPQPACIGQRAPQQKYIGPVGMAPNTQVHTIAHQDNFIITARNAALAQPPAGKQLYRLTFGKSNASPNSLVTVTGFYGYCITRVKVDKGPTDPA